MLNTYSSSAPEKVLLETLVPIPQYFFDSLIARGSLEAAKVPTFPTADPVFPYYNDPNFELILTYAQYDLMWYMYVNSYMINLITATDMVEASGNTLTFSQKIEHVLNMDVLLYD